MAFCIISQFAIFDLQRQWIIAAYEAYKSKDNNSDKDKKYELEFYISFLFHHIYYNSEWENEVEIISNSKHEFSRYRNCKSYGFTLPNFTFKVLLETMKPNRILELIQYLLLEKKILLVQSQYSNNSIIIESLLSLISPLYFFKSI